MERYRKSIAILVLLLIWQLFAGAVDNDFLIPTPYAVLQTMGNQLQHSIFYETILQTLVRSLSGLLFAFISAMLLAFLAYFSKLVYDVCYPFLLLTRSVPNIAFIIIILVWFGSESSALIVSFLILFPMIFSNIYTALLHIDDGYKHVIDLYPERMRYKITKIYIPLLKGAMQASLLTGVSLAFKVGVMAEIVGQVQVGIGRQLNIARLNSDMSSVFAWTGWIILILIVLEALIYMVYQDNKKKEHLTR